MERRSFLALSAFAALRCEARGLSGLKIGVTDWNLKQTAKVAAVDLAARLRFAGVQVSLGRDAKDGRLPLDQPELLDQYRQAAKARKIALNGTCLDVLHVNYLKKDPLGQKWVREGIRLTKALQIKVMLLPFFGAGALETAAEKDYVGDVLRDLGPEAEKAGVILGIENTISAEDNVRIIERSQSKAVLVYYDIGNSTLGGFRVAREIEWLGKNRICQMHFKDNPHYLGEGKIDLVEVLRVLSRIGYEGFANLETDAPSRSVEADMQRNLAFIRKSIAQVQGT